MCRTDPLGSFVKVLWFGISTCELVFPDGGIDPAIGGTTEERRTRKTWGGGSHKERSVRGNEEAAGRHRKPISVSHSQRISLKLVYIILIIYYMQPFEGSFQMKPVEPFLPFSLSPASQGILVHKVPRDNLYLNTVVLRSIKQSVRGAASDRRLAHLGVVQRQIAGLPGILEFLENNCPWMSWKFSIFKCCPGKWR